jgi:hypothetical protein
MQSCVHGQSAAVRRACGEQRDEATGVIRSAFGPATDRQPSAGLDGSGAAIAGPVHPHVSWESAAMRRVAPDRGLAGCGGRLRVGRWEPRNPTNGRQDKSADCGRAYVVGCAGLFGHLRQRAAGSFGNFGSNSNAPTAIHPRPSRSCCDRHACQRVCFGRGASSTATAAPTSNDFRGEAIRVRRKLGYRRDLRRPVIYEGRSTFGRGRLP